MFCCASPIALPTTIVAMASRQTARCQLRELRRERLEPDAEERRERRRLHRRRHVRRDRRRRAVVDVGRPHVERRGRRP